MLGALDIASVHHCRTVDNIGAQHNQLGVWHIHMRVLNTVFWQIEMGVSITLYYVDSPLNPADPLSRALYEIPICEVMLEHA